MTFPARSSKYGAKRTVVDGITFASKREATRYSELKLLERAGTISELTLQPSYKLMIGTDLICRYRADFSYKERGVGPVVEDAKGVETQIFRLKRKLMRALLGIEVRTV